MSSVKSLWLISSQYSFYTVQLLLLESKSGWYSNNQEIPRDQDLSKLFKSMEQIDAVPGHLKDSRAFQILPKILPTDH